LELRRLILVALFPDSEHWLALEGIGNLGFLVLETVHAPELEVGDVSKLVTQLRKVQHDVPTLDAPD
jgi:hypothetical protein